MSFFSKFLKKKYKSYCFCYNCRQRTEVQIDKGKTVSEGIAGMPCENCGCYTLTADKADLNSIRKKQMAETEETKRMQTKVPKMKEPLPEPLPEERLSFKPRPAIPVFWRMADGKR